MYLPIPSDRDQTKLVCIICEEKAITNHSANRIYCRNCKHRYSYQKAALEARIIEYFGFAIPALAVSRMLNKNYKTVYRIYHRLQEKLLDYTIKHAETLISIDIGYQKGLFNQVNNRKKSLSDKEFQLVLVVKANYALVLLTEKNCGLGGKLDGVEKIYYRNLSAMRDFRDLSFIATAAPRLWRLFKKRIALARGVGNQNILIYVKTAEFLYNLGGQNPQKHLKSIWFSR